MNDQVADHEFQQEFLKILGLDGKKVVQLEMEMSVEGLTVITVERYLTQDEALKMLPLFERYKLIKKE